MNEIEKNNQIIEARAEQLANRIEALVVEARKKITSTVNVAMVYTNYEIGRYIVEDEQGGKIRAEYGKGVLNAVSARLTAKLGKGWSVENLTAMRKFYVLYSKTVTSGYEIQGTEIQTTDLEIQDENRNYWKYLKAKLRKEKNEVVSATTQFKLTAADGKKRLTDVLNQGDVELLAKNIHNAKAMAFLDWFKYSENSIDGRSRKKAYTLIEGNIVADKDIGTVKALQQIHAYIFGGLYDFAGQIRTKTIWKDGTMFCRAEYLMKNLRMIEAMPETTFNEIVNKYVEMNVAHPFMEGNGRSTRIWLDQIFKKRLGLCVDWSKIDKKAYLEAMRQSTTDASAIKALFQGAMTDRIDDREIFMKGIDYSYYYEQSDLVSEEPNLFELDRTRGLSNVIQQEDEV